MHNNLIILAGGASSRMKKPATSKTIDSNETAQANNRSKSLISLDKTGRPVLDYLLYNAKKRVTKTSILLSMKKEVCLKSSTVVKIKITILTD